MILFTIIGALIGAGFASGQEIYIFFYRFGLNGLFGIFLCSAILGYIIYKTLNIILKTDIKNYKDLLKKILENKNKLINTINIIINLFLCITFFIMISGFGTYFYQEFRNKQHNRKHLYCNYMLLYFFKKHRRYNKNK